MIVNILLTPFLINDIIFRTGGYCEKSMGFYPTLMYGYI